MTSRTFPARAALAAAAASMLLVGGIPARAEAPPANLVARTSPAGDYLAARFASNERDTAAAAAYYRALLKFFPRNGEILERTFLTVLADGSVEEAAGLAERLVKLDPEHRLARLVLGVKALKNKQYVTARSNLRRSVRGPIADLTATLLSAWSQLGSGTPRAGVEAIDALQGPDWYASFKDLNAGLILDAAGLKAQAGKRLEQALMQDARTLRAVDAYGRWATRSDNKELALQTYTNFDKMLPNHPLVVEAIKEIQAGRTLPPLVRTPQEGAAEVLYGLGAALGRQGGEDLALVYLQLTLWLDPNHPLALLTLADLYENLKKHDEAIAIYRRVPENSPLRPNADIQIGLNLDAAGQYDAAKAELEKLVAKDPKDREAIVALGGVLRGKQQFTEAAKVYTQAIDLLQAPTEANWPLFYFRGISYERSKEWAKSEADLKKALELHPDQPHVLNYLGYSWIDQGQHLDEGMEMIRKAVTLRPDDGYIVDSLGWAYFKVGKYDDAVTQLERAVELKPQDPVINDHLGDAYWRVGRKLEARFKWNQARDLKPEPDDLAKIERKMAVGLDEAQKASADKPAATEKPANGG